MTQTPPFQRLIRFIDDEGKERYGDVPPEVQISDIESSSTPVTIITGDLKSGFSRTSSTAVVKKLLCPVAHVPIVPCIGLNYRAHATEFNMTPPDNPPVFVKPSDAITGPFDDIYIQKDLQEKLDYEGELTVVIGRDAKNVAPDDAFDYVLGYTCGNDVTARHFQLPDSKSGGQYGYSKSFDQFAPIGPCITSTAIIKDPQDLNYVTKVNGEVRQKTSTSDMIYSVKRIIAHLSRGSTLRAGTCIMTGTPSGIGFFMQPPGFLKDGDVVEVEIEKIGTLKNRVVFE